MDIRTRSVFLKKELSVTSAKYKGKREANECSVRSKILNCGSTKNLALERVERRSRTLGQGSDEDGDLPILS